jgi:hypothetical protein
MFALSCIYAICLGGAHGRWAAATIICSNLFVIGVWSAQDWQSVSPMLLAIDFLGCFCFAYFWTKFKKNWMLHCTWLHMAKVATHFSILVSSTFQPFLYQSLLQFWMVVILLTMTLGIWSVRHVPK